jgi:hypothetical protein
MLKIRHEQLEVLNQVAFEHFILRMVDHLISTFPEHFDSVDDEDIYSFVNNGVERAKTHGIEGEYDIQRFLECCTVYGENFGEAPESQWAKPFLERADLDGTEKMDQINDYELFVLSNEA